MRIDMYLQEAADVGVLRPILYNLQRRGHDAQMVVEPPGIHSGWVVPPTSRGGLRYAAMSRDGHEETLDALQRLGLPALARGRHLGAHAVVTRAEGGALLGYGGTRIRACLDSPLGVDATTWGEASHGFDAILVNGRLGRLRFRQIVGDDRIAEVGHPAAAAFQRAGAEQEVRRNAHGLNQRRRTLLYLPASGADSSVGRFAEVIAALGRQYNLVLRPEPRSIRFEMDRFATLRRSPWVTVDTSGSSVLPTMMMADLVLVDLASSRLAEACLLDRPAVALGQRIPGAADTVAGLLEAVPVLTDSAQLRPFIEHALHQDDYAEGRSHLASLVYANLDGEDDRVAAAEVERLAERLPGRRSAPVRSRGNRPADVGLSAAS